MTDKPMKAYEVRDGDEGECVIAFATNGATARREGGEELGLSFEEVESCARAPWADEYAPGPVPLSAYLANGWWFYCSHCGVRFDAEYGRHGEFNEDRDDEFDPVEDGRGHYCSPTCKMKHWAENQDYVAHQCAAIEAALIRWPMATGVTANDCVKAYPSHDHKWRAQFVLPGVKYPVWWTPGESTVTVSQCDIDEFKRLYGASEPA